MTANVREEENKDATDKFIDNTKDDKEMIFSSTLVSWVVHS